MIFPMRDKADVYLILPALKDKVPMCGDTPENIAIGILRGELHVLLGYDETEQELQGFCVYRPLNLGRCFIFALYAPGLGWKLRKDFFNHMRDLGFTTFRWASSVDDRIWSTLTPGAKKLWSVWEWTNLQ